MLGIAESVIGIGGKILDKFVEDKDLKTKIAAELKKEALKLDALQAQANIEQSKHPSIFVAGARPAIMWICALGLLTQFFIMPLAEWGCAIWAPHITLPSLSTDGLLTLTLSLLGLGGMRTAEKWKGVARNNMKGGQ
jgi:hypothetical protein